jgi:tetratricopeptide (TPR) repeat protein
MKHWSGKIVMWLVICLQTSGLYSQDFADKEYYLVDSLTLSSISISEKVLIDSCLHLFHAASNDTSQIHAINYLVEQSWDNHVWPKYNNWIYEYTQALLENNPKEEVIETLLQQHAAAINNKGYLFIEMGEADSGLAYYLKSLAVFEQINDSGSIASSLNNIGYAYDFKNDQNTALGFYKRSAEIQKKIGDEKELAVTYNNIGAIYRNKGVIQKAMEYYLESLKLRTKTGDKRGEAYTLNNIAFVYMDQKENAKALSYFKQSLAISKQIEISSIMAISLNNIGLIYDNYGDPDCSEDESTCEIKSFYLALGYYYQSLQIDIDNDREREIAISLNNIGGVYLQLAKLEPEKTIFYKDTANTIFQNAHQIFKDVNHPHGECKVLINRSQLALLDGDVKRAEEFALKSLKLAQETEFAEDIKESSFLLSSIYEKQEKGMDALRMYKLSVTIRDSINNEENEKSVMLQEVKYQFEKSQLLEVQAQKEYARIAKEETDQRNSIQYLGISIGLFILFGMVFFIGKIELPKWAIELVIFLPFLILFEFLLVTLDSRIENLSGGIPAYKLLINVVLAAIIFPAHSFLESKFKRRLFQNKLVSG